MRRIRSLKSSIRITVAVIGFILYFAAVLATASVSARRLKRDYALSMIGAVKTFDALVSDRLQESEALLERLIAEAPGDEGREIIDWIRNQFDLLGSPDLFYGIDELGRISSIEDQYDQYLGLDLSHIEHVTEDSPVSDVHQSLFSLKPVVSLRYPLPTGDLLVQEKDLRWIIPLARNFDRNEIVDNGQLFILANNGTVVYHADSSLMNSRHNLGFELKEFSDPDAYGLQNLTYHDKRYIACQETLEVLEGWQVYLIVPVRVLYEHVQEIGVQLIVVLAVILGGSIGLLHLWLLRKLSLPAGRIVSSVSDRAGRTLFDPIPLDVAAGTKELVLIVEAYNSLQDRLKLATETLRESEERYRILVETLTDAVFKIDTEGNFTYLNPIFSKMTGWPIKDVVGHPFSAFLAPEYRQSTTDRFRRGLEGDVIPPYEVDFLLPDGGRLSVELNVTTMFGSDGRTIGRIGVARDVGPRKEADRALRESEERFRSVVEHSHDGIMIVDDAFRFLYVNEQLSTMLGYEPEEIIGHEFGDFLDEGSRQLVSRRYQDRQKGHDVPSRYEFDIVRKDGTRRQVEISSTIITDQSGRARTVAQLLDITDRKRIEQEKHRLETQLIQAQKLEAVGLLAGGIAHDFNNLLQVVRGYTELLLVGGEGESDSPHDLQEILKATNRATELTQQLLTFSRKIESKPALVNLNQHLQDTTKLLERTLPKMIEIKLILDQELPLIQVDPGQFEQVFLNLAVNARDAMRTGGTLTVRTEQVYLNVEFCKEHLEMTPGPYVLLSVSDTGQGIAPEDLRRVFEPFFSTKEVGEGTGLGLAMVYGIIRNHDGYITCVSERGCGSTFKVYLPVTRTTRQSRQKREEVPVKGGSETILLVDDEPSVRDLAQKILQRSGYRVRTAESGEKALEIFQGEGEEVDMVILDMIMPGMGGSRCLQEMLQIEPNTKVLVTSGFSGNGSANGTLEAGARGFLNKPYEIKQMLRAVRDVLDT